MSASRCPSDSELRGFCASAGGDDSRVWIAGHLRACAACEAKVLGLVRPTEAIRSGGMVALRPLDPTSWTQEPASLTLGRAPWPILADYEILERLGAGAAGVVYKARHRGLNRLVALKCIRGADIDVGRVRREAEAVAHLQHPNIVQIYEAFERGGEQFLALELVGGGSLAEHLAGKPQPPGVAAALLATLAQAIGYAHERGVVHRDLKPANVLLHRTVRSQKSEVRSQKSEVRGQKSEVRGQKSEDRD